MNKLYLTSINGFAASVFKKESMNVGIYISKYGSEKYITKYKINISKDDLFAINVFQEEKCKSMYLTFNIYDDTNFDLFNFISNYQVYSLNFDYELYMKPTHTGGFITAVNPYIILTDDELFYVYLKFSEHIQGKS